MAPSSTPLARLADAGVAIWLDDLSRERLRTGNLAELVADAGVVGVTTNPSIFAERAVEGRRLRRAARASSPPTAPTWTRRSSASPPTTSGRPPTSCARSTTRTDGVDGRVSIEVDPRLAKDTDGTIASAKSLWSTVDRPNVFIKIPATREGLPAITAVLAEGISVNVTLIFSLERYRAVLDAFQSGLEQAQANGHDLAPIASVASFFVSRVDTAIDPRARRDRHARGRGPARQGRDRQRPPRLRALRGGRRRRPLDGAGRRRRAPAAPAVGVDRRQGHGVPGHAVRRRAGRRRRRQHDARGHAEGGRRPRRRRQRHGHRDAAGVGAPSSTASRGSASTSTRSPSSWRSRASRSSTASWGRPPRHGRRRPRRAAAEQNAAGGRQVSPSKVVRRATTRCATPATVGCRGSPGRAAWSSSASRATWPARS